MAAMFDPPDAPQRIREKVAIGVLPLASPTRSWAGFGSGQLCAACDRAITITQTELKIQVEGERAFILHMGCAGLLEVERRTWEAT
jgi:hypothetical protein